LAATQVTALAPTQPFIICQVSRSCALHMTILTPFTPVNFTFHFLSPPSEFSLSSVFSLFSSLVYQSLILALSPLHHSPFSSQNTNYKTHQIPSFPKIHKPNPIKSTNNQHKPHQIYCQNQHKPNKHLWSTKRQTKL
jgi:hypothetical protein